MTAALSVGAQTPRILDARPRAATPDDNPALLALAAACEMRGDIGLRIDREPDFFALNRLEGDQWQLGVMPGLVPRSVAGCVAASARRVYIDGAPRLTTYVGDFKVHPAVSYTHLTLPTTPYV